MDRLLSARIAQGFRTSRGTYGDPHHSKPKTRSNSRARPEEPNQPGHFFEGRPVRSRSAGLDTDQK